jgi:integrase/recombinase XerD
MGIKRAIKKSKDCELITLNQAFEEFILEKEARGLSEATIHNYQHSFTTFYNFHEFTDETTTDEIKPTHFFKWMNTQRLAGAKHTSVNHYLRDLRAFFSWCMDLDRAYISPPFKIEMMEGQEEQIKLFTDEDIEKLLEKPRKNDSFANWRTWAIVNWVLGTGNRAATICDIKIGDVNYSKKEITLGHTKNKKAQIIPLSSSLETVLKEYVRVWLRDADINSWLFPNVGAEKLSTNALRHSFSRYCQDRDVEQTNIHGLRHNFAKGWVRNNGNMFALQKILGHSTLDMTKRYVKLYGEDLKEDFDKYNPLDTIKRNTKRTQKIKKS